jgi:membrane-associated phospholipid phosphatase
VNTRLRPTVGRLLNDAGFSFAPRGREDALRQGLIMVACYAAYDLTRALAQGREAVALANGVFFMNLEKALGIWWEPWIQGHVSAVGPLMNFLVWAYANLHLPIIIGAMVWLFTQRRGEWTLYRNWFLAMNFIAVIVFALLPTAPPRMIFTSGVADIDFLHGVRAHIFENGVLANPFAAMPSLHFAYALFIAIMLFALASDRWLRFGGFAYPIVVFVAIVATGNHFIIDAIAGGLVVLAAWVFAVNVQPSAAPQSAAVTVRERDG